MRTSMDRIQVNGKGTSFGPAATPSNQPKDLVLQMVISKPSIKNASARALSSLSPNEVLACEEIMAKGWDTFVDVGRALAAIRDKRLYRADFDTFEAYCRQKWQYGKSHAYRLIGAAEVIACLSPIGDIPLPRNEAQVRPLLGLKAEEVQAVWREVVKKAGKKNVTAKLVKQAAAQFRQSIGAPRPSIKPVQTAEAVRRTILEADKLLQRAKRLLETGNVDAAAALVSELSRVGEIFIRGS